MTGILNILAGSISSAIKDGYFNLVSLLLPGNGTNGAQNNTFLDSSSNNFTITRNGNTTQGTFTPFSQTGWGNYFDGSGDYLSVPDNDALDLTGDFTIECWVYLTNVSPGYNPTVVARWGASGGQIYTMQVQNGGTFRIITSAGTWTGGSVSANTWTHLAISRSGSSLRLFNNGTLQSTNTDSTSLSGTQVTSIGGESDGAQSVPGYISNVRILKGTAQYTASFTPPTAQLTAITNTSLLTCQSNRFVDNSSNAFTITVGGTPSVQAFSPFAPTAAYSATDVGGSGYFDGSGDYLTAVSSSTTIGTQAFTVEFWVYITGNGGDYVIQNGSGGLQIWSGIGGGGAIAIGYANVSNLFTANTAPPKNQWVHIAVSKDATLARVYLNGVLDGSTTPTGWNFSGSGDFQFCVGNTTPTAYISGMRITIGAALYTANFTPPTSPPTASVSSGTVRVLLNFTNAGITDATAKNVLETVGNASISTAQSKFGGSSMYFDGTGDWLQIPNNQFYNFGAGDFTIECWLYPTASGVGTIIAKRSGSNTAWLQLYYDSTNKIGVVVSFDGSTWGINSVGSTTVSLNTWTHVALVRSGSSFKTYINGTADISATNSGSINFPSDAVTIGAGATSGIQVLTGYIDDLRITRFARYTSNFTAPTAAFALQ